MTIEEARKACEENLLCLLHFPRNGPYIPTEDVSVYIIAVWDDFNHSFWGLPPSKFQYEHNYGVQFVSARDPGGRASAMAGLKSIEAALSLASKKE